jgi:DNA-binding GntR family transcriptional regulator
VVAPLVSEDAVDAYSLRLLLESEALRIDASAWASPSNYIEMLEIEADYSQMGRLNRLFHIALYSKAPNRRLLRLVEDGLNEEERFLRFNLSAMGLGLGLGLGKLAQDDHWELLNAASEKDVDKAAMLSVILIAASKPSLATSRTALIQFRESLSDTHETVSTSNPSTPISVSATWRVLGICCL